MSDLIQRLRSSAQFYEDANEYEGPREHLMREAADELERLVQDSEARESWTRVQDDEIERLTRERDELQRLRIAEVFPYRVEIDRLRAALEQIAASSAIKFGDTHASYRWTKLRDTARAALADKEDPLVAKYEEWQEGK
jgi:hypothetical protein